MLGVERAAAKYALLFLEEFVFAREFDICFNVV